MRYFPLWLQYFREHPPLSLVQYCTEPVITEALHNLTEIDEETPGNFSAIDDENFIEDLPVFDDEPNSALFSFILQFCTFWLAYYLRIFRNGKALGRRVKYVNFCL